MLGLVDYGSSDDEDSAPVTHDEHVPTTTIRTITTSSSTTITSKRIERDDNRKDNERKRDRCEGESHQDSSTSTRPKVVECRSFQNNINNRNENVTTNSSNSSSDMPAIRPNNNVERSSKFIPTSEILQTKSASDFHEFVKLYNLDERGSNLWKKPISQSSIQSTTESKEAIEVKRSERRSRWDINDN